LLPHHNPMSSLNLPHPHPRVSLIHHPSSIMQQGAQTQTQTQHHHVDVDVGPEEAGRECVVTFIQRVSVQEAAAVHIHSDMYRMMSMNMIMKRRMKRSLQRPPSAITRIVCFFPVLVLLLSGVMMQTIAEESSSTGGVGDGDDGGGAPLASLPIDSRVAIGLACGLIVAVCACMFLCAKRHMRESIELPMKQERDGRSRAERQGRRLSGMDRRLNAKLELARRGWRPNGDTIELMQPAIIPAGPDPVERAKLVQHAQMSVLHGGSMGGLGVCTYGAFHAQDFKDVSWATSDLLAAFKSSGHSLDVLLVANQTTFMSLLSGIIPFIIVFTLPFHELILENVLPLSDWYGPIRSVQFDRCMIIAASALTVHLAAAMAARHIYYYDRAPALAAWKQKQKEMAQSRSRVADMQQQPATATDGEHRQTDLASMASKQQQHLMALSPTAQTALASSNDVHLISPSHSALHSLTHLMPPTQMQTTGAALPSGTPVPSSPLASTRPAHVNQVPDGMTIQMNSPSGAASSPFASVPSATRSSSSPAAASPRIPDSQPNPAVVSPLEVRRATDPTLLPLSLLCILSLAAYGPLGWQGYVSCDESGGRQYGITSTPSIYWPPSAGHGPSITFILCCMVGMTMIIPIGYSLKLLALFYPRKVHPALINTNKIE